MSLSTNSLVNAAKRYVAPALLSTLVAIGTVAVIDHTGVHAASSTTAAPLSDNSVAPLVSLDQAVEALVNHVHAVGGEHCGDVDAFLREETAQEQRQGGGFGNCRRGCSSSLGLAAAGACRCSLSSNRWSTELAVGRDHLVGWLHSDQQSCGRWSQGHQGDAA